MQDRESIIAAAERPTLKSRKQDKTWNKDHVPRSGREARDRPRGGPEPGAASWPEDSVLQTAETAPRRTGRPGKQESGARGQEAGSALAGIKMTQRREKLISHALSRILRHEALDHDLPMHSAGYVPILDVVTVQSLWNHQVSPAEVHHAAQINKKQRFEIQTVNGVACIRAVQGHDQRLAAFYNLSDSEMLQLLELPRAPRYAIHGTMLKHYDAIKDGGLCRRQRRHIHFIEDTNAAEARTEDREASGLRAGSEIMLWVDIHKCLRCGMSFYRAPNNVLLSPGQDGWILPSFILWVQVTSTGQFVEAAEGQHLPTTKAVRDAIRISGQRTPRREREKNPMRSPCPGSRSELHEPRTYHVNTHVTDMRALDFAQVNDEHTRWHEAELSRLYIAPHVSSPAWSLQLNLRTVYTAATGGDSTHLESRKFMPTLHCPIPWQDHPYHMVSAPQPHFTHYALVARLHPNQMHTRCRNPHNFRLRWPLTMPSPSSQNRSARRLPSRLRESQAQPTGQLLELRESAAAKARAREQQSAARAQQATSRDEEPWWSTHYDPGSWSWSMWTPHSSDWQWQRDQSTAPEPAPTSAPEGPNIAQDTEQEMGPALGSQDPHVQAARRRSTDSTEIFIGTATSQLRPDAGSTEYQLRGSGHANRNCKAEHGAGADRRQ